MKKKYHVSDSIKEIANKAAKIPGVKPLLKPAYYWYKKRIEKQRNMHFRANALDALKLFDKLLTDSGFEYTLAFGTLLGAVREKGFIKHDLDIDVAMWAEDWNPHLRTCLEAGGFKLAHSFEIEEGKWGREETYVYNDIPIDIFYFYPMIDLYPYCCDFLGYSDAPTYRMCNEKYGGARPRRIEIPMEHERVLTKFEDTVFYIPRNAHEILSFRYGDSYMIPNAKWTINSNNAHIIEWKEKKGIYKEYHL